MRSGEEIALEPTGLDALCPSKPQEKTTREVAAVDKGAREAREGIRAPARDDNSVPSERIAAESISPCASRPPAGRRTEDKAEATGEQAPEALIAADGDEKGGQEGNGGPVGVFGPNGDGTERISQKKVLSSARKEQAAGRLGACADNDKEISGRGSAAAASGRGPNEDSTRKETAQGLLAREEDDGPKAQVTRKLAAGGDETTKDSEKRMFGAEAERGTEEMKAAYEQPALEV